MRKTSIELKLIIVIGINAMIKPMSPTRQAFKAPIFRPINPAGSAKITEKATKAAKIYPAVDSSNNKTSVA